MPRIGLRREPGLRRRHRSGHEQAEIDEVAAVERNLLDGLAGDDVADGAVARSTSGEFRADDDGLAAFADRQVEVADQRAADLDVSASMTSVRNPGASAVTLYVPAGIAADVVVPFAIGDGGDGETGRVVAHADHGRRDHRARLVDDASLENRRGLRLHGRRSAQHHGARPSRHDVP